MFTWQFNTKKEKSASWYTIALVIAIALIIWWFLTQMYIMSVVVLLVIWVYILIENNSPDVFDVEINDNWILIWEEFYDFPKIEAFSILYNKNIAVSLRIRLNSKGFKLLDVPLDWKYSAADIRSFLAQFIKEDEKSELSSLDSLTNYLKL
jgi:hypothetical protein